MKIMRHLILIVLCCWSLSLYGQTCNIELRTSSIECANNNSPSDPSDDVFYFALKALNPDGGGWTATIRGMTFTGVYDQAQHIGPFAIAAGLLEIEVMDQTNSGCTASITVIPPITCSRGGGELACTNTIMENGSFEEGLLGWIPAPQTTGISISTDAFDGGKALHVEAPADDSRNVNLLQRINGFAPNTHYRFSYFAKQLNTNNDRNPGTVRLGIVFFNNNGQIIYYEDMHKVLSEEYQEYAALIKTPAAMGYAQLRILAISTEDSGVAEALIDQICLQEVDRTPCNMQVEIFDVDCGPVEGNFRKATFNYTITGYDLPAGASWATWMSDELDHIDFPIRYLNGGTLPAAGQGSIYMSAGLTTINQPFYISGRLCEDVVEIDCNSDDNKLPRLEHSLINTPDDYHRSVQGIMIYNGTRANNLEKQPLQSIQFRGLFPNPAQNELTIEIESQEAIEQLGLRIFDQNGLLVLTKQVSLMKGQNRLRILIDALPAGGYALLPETKQQYQPLYFVKM